MIAFFSVAPFISGSERCLQIMIGEALNDGLKPILITSPASPMSEWAEKNSLKHFEIELNPVKVKSTLSWIWQLIKLSIILKKNRIKAVHSNQIWSYRAASSVARILGLKRICHFRDPLDSGSAYWLPSKPDISIFVSDYIKKQYIVQFAEDEPESGVTLIDPIRRKPSKNRVNVLEAQEKARKSLRISNTSFVFGFIGQIAPIKGLLETIQFLSEIKRSDWLFLIAGDDPNNGKEYYKRCLNEVESRDLSDKVRFLGFQEDVDRIYQAVDVILLLSKDEPLGLIPLEAGAHYTPSIVSNVGGLPETVSQGEAGWIVDLNDRSQIKNTIDSITREDALSMGERSRNFIETINDPQRYWTTLKQLYRKIGINI